MRQFQMQHEDKVRVVHQFQYKGWHDFDVPKNLVGTLELISLVSKEQVRYKSLGTSGLIIVHCSAGCGRSGTFCTISTVIARLKGKKYLNKEEKMGEVDLIYQTVSKFREQRVSMMQTL